MIVKNYEKKENQLNAKITMHAEHRKTEISSNTLEKSSFFSTFFIWCYYISKCCLLTLILS